jgi:tetratricopeptide (TPR) repeat protein
MQRILTVLLAAATALTAQPQPSPRELIDAGHYKRLAVYLGSHNGSDAETLYLQATLKEVQGDLDAAEKLAERAVAADPKQAQYHYRLSSIVGQKAQKAGVLRQVGLGRSFKKECEAALALNPNHIEALKNMMQFHLHAPGIIGGDKAKANAIADQLLKLDPVEGFQAQIEIARAEKQDANVDGIVRKVLEMRTETFQAHMMVGNYLVAQKKYDEAERHAREAIRIHPDRAVPHSLLAAMLVRQDKWSDLDAALGQAEKDVPDNLYPLYRAGNALLDRKVDLARAERYFRKYLSQDAEFRMPSHSVAHWRLGLVLEQQGRKPEALAEYQTAIKLDPNSPAKQELKKK